MRLEDYNLTRCAKCNRLMEKKEGQTLCSRCSAETEQQNKLNLETLQSLSPDSLKLKTSPTHTSAKPTSDFEQIETTEELATPIKTSLCSRCKKMPKLPRRELCLSCMTELYKSLQEVSEEITKEQQHNPYEDIVELQKTLSSVRKLEPFKRIRAEGLTWIKRPR